MPLHWEKKALSKSDAQQPTHGYPVPYLRLTKIGNAMNTQTWFREEFFGDAHWVDGHFGKYDVEETHVELAVTILGQNRGPRTMLVTHDPERQNRGRSTPNTWLHWDDATRGELQDQDLSGHLTSLDRNDNGIYRLTIY